MKRFLIIVIIMLGVHSLIAQIDREEIVSVVKEAIEESNSSKRKVKYTTLGLEDSKRTEEKLRQAQIAVDNYTKESEKFYEKNKKYVLPNYQERQQQNKEADVRALEVAKGVVKEAEKVYDENMKSGITNISHNVEPWWVSVNTNESQEEVNTYNSESSDIKSTEKTELNRNMEYFLYISASLFVICIGSITMQRVKNPDAAIEFTLLGKLILLLMPMIAFVFLVITVSKIVNLKWYWSILVSFITYLFTWRFLTRNYCLFFGIKTKPFLSFTEGKMIRANVHLEDAILTLVVGVVMLLIAY